MALGRLAFDVYLGILREQGKIARRSAFVFAHDAEHRTGEGQPLLISSYHPSQQNTSTGKLTEAMFRAVFQRARRRLQLALAVTARRENARTAAEHPAARHRAERYTDYGPASAPW